MSQQKRVGNGGPYMPGPSMCIICLDDLLAFDIETETEDASLRPIVATKCGHQFHTKCLNQWFKSISRTDNDDPALKPCPYCRREMRWCDTKRIFPVNMDMIVNPKDTSYRGCRPVPATCTICYEYVLSFCGGNEGIPFPRPYVATKCGHLFHTTCIITEWFKQTRRDETELKPCPYCKKEMRSYELKRILPVSAGEEMTL